MVKTATPYDDLHVVPIDDKRKHNISFDCWCNPKVDGEFPPYTVVHNAADGGEIYERLRDLKEKNIPKV